MEKKGKIIFINTSVSIMTWNVNRLIFQLKEWIKTPSEYETWFKREKKKKLYVAYKRLSLKINEQKGERISHININQKTAVIASLT